MSGNPKIVIVGSSLTAISTLCTVEKYLPKMRVPAEIVLISDRDYFFIKSLLFHKLSNTCDFSDLAQNIRETGFIKPGVSFVKAVVEDIDLNLKIIKTSKGEIKYNYLILSPDADEVTSEKKLQGVFRADTPSDITKLQMHVHKVLELAVVSKESSLRTSLLSFSVLSEKSNGFETAFALSDYVEKLIDEQFPELNKSQVKINLIEENNNISPYKDSFSNCRIYYCLNKKRIVIYTNSKITNFENNKIEINGEKSLIASTVIYCPQNRFSRLIKLLSLKKDDKCFATVDLYLKAEGYEDVYVVGECSNCIDLGEDIIQSEFFFKQQALLSSYNVFAQINNIPQKPMKLPMNINFVFQGSKNSLVQVKGIYFDGILGWVFNRVYLALSFSGIRKKISNLCRIFISLFNLEDDLILDDYEIVSDNVNAEKLTTKE